MSGRSLHTIRTYLRIALVVILVASILMGFALRHTAVSSRLAIVVALLAALYSLAAVPLFLSGLHNFKAGMRKSYILLCIGIGLFGLAQIQVPVINIFGWFAWLNSGGAAAVYLLGIVPMLLGMRKLAKILDIDTPWSSLLICMLAAVVTAVAASFLPHIPTKVKELAFDMLSAVVVWDAFVVLFSGMLALKIRSVVAVAYRRSLLWLAAAFFCLVFAGAHFLVTHLAVADGSWYYDYSLAILPFTLGALLFVKAGYEFTAIGYALGDPEPAHTAATTQQVSPIEVVSYVASLASNPKDIDPLLDEVRIISARLQPGQNPTPADVQTLSAAYGGLVEYLTKSDPLRLYTEISIRQAIAKRFGSDAVIWQLAKA